MCCQDCPDSAPLNLPLLSVLACVQTASQQTRAAGDGWVWLEGKEGEALVGLNQAQRRGTAAQYHHPAAHLAHPPTQPCAAALFLGLSIGLLALIIFAFVACWRCSRVRPAPELQPSLPPNEPAAVKGEHGRAVKWSSMLCSTW